MHRQCHATATQFPLNFLCNTEKERGRRIQIKKGEERATNLSESVNYNSVPSSIHLLHMHNNSNFIMATKSSASAPEVLFITSSLLCFTIYFFLGKRLENKSVFFEPLPQKRGDTHKSFFSPCFSNSGETTKMTVVACSFFYLFAVICAVRLI